MSKVLAAIALAAAPFAAAPFAAAAAADNYTIDPTHASVLFAIDHQGLSTVHGRFDKFAGKFSIDRTAKKGDVDLTIDTASVNTNDNEREAGSARATSTCARPTSSTPRNFRR